MLAERIEGWFDEATRKGRLQGRLEGRLEGEARVLARLLTRRFGELPDWVGVRLNEATEEQLVCWTEAVLDAPSLAAVFVEPPADH